MESAILGRFSNSGSKINISTQGCYPHFVIDKVSPADSREASRLMSGPYITQRFDYPKCHPLRMIARVLL
jgi:hypothetical protein